MWLLLGASDRGKSHHDGGYWKRSSPHREILQSDGELGSKALELTA